MKSILFSMLLMSTSLVFAQGTILSSVSKAPDVLELDILTRGNFGPSLRHIEKTNGKITGSVKTEFAPHLFMFQNHIFRSTLTHISCDGDVSLEKDQNNLQVIVVKSIRVCLDDNGLVVAHSLGTPTQLTEEQGKVSIAKIMAKRDKVVAPASVSQSEERKDRKSLLPGMASDGANASAQ